LLFNSWVFVAFFVVVYTAYLLLQGRLRSQNLLLLGAGWTFYGYWDWRFLSLLIFSTCLDYALALKIEGSEDERIRKRLLAVSLVSSLSLLGFFKYFNFFAETASTLLRTAGFAPDFVTLRIILPLGISFYTFQTMSYTVDVYRRKLPATRHFVDFAVFVCFFPHLVAGPIQRAVGLLPQVARPRQISLSQVNAALGLLLWGYLKKVAIADNVGPIADQIFDHYTQYQGFDVLIGIVAFTIQIYCDFSGYSDIARGLAKLLGFELMVNFYFPYLALNPSDFWSRWHVALSTWLREYLYIPLGGNKHGRLKTYRNLLVTMLLGGLWHGAAWNYVLWGGYHGLLLIGYRLAGVVRDDAGKVVREPAFWSRVVQRGVMLTLVMAGWVLFRSRSFDQIVYMLTHVGWQRSAFSHAFATDLFAFAGILVIVELWQFWVEDPLVITKLRVVPRACAYAVMLLWLAIAGARNAVEFIYFQF
jgi:D-alanyl-lipoteichoic acid acyltransferase DltB (MBOAT superfamily)